MKKSIIYITLCFLFELSLSAQITYTLSVEELFDRGIQNSVAIQASIVKTQISSEKTLLAKNKQLPHIGVEGSLGYVGTPVILNPDLSFLERDPIPKWEQDYRVAARQPLYEGGRIRNEIKRSELEKEIAQLSLQNDKSDLRLWLIGKYLDLFNLYKKRDVYAQNIEQAKKRLHDIEKMKEQGVVTTNDVLRSKLLLNNFDLAYRETENDIALVSQQLTIVLGMDETTLIQPDSSFLTSYMKIQPVNEYVDQAYRQHPGLKIAQTNISLAQNTLKMAKADYLPSLSLGAGVGLTRPIPYLIPVEDLFINTWGVTLNLSYNLSALFDIKHNTNVAKQQIQLQELFQEQQKQAIRTEIKAAYLKHQEAEDRIKVLQESLVQSKENYRIENNKYFNQLSILTDLLDAITTQLNVELQLTAAKTNAIYTYYQLLKASGNL
ncbi:MAG: TolC family protein [Candidatus Azobacteroides sp.]|nr:TolC family protein [Candidatus Azobacteroides sp.]